MAFIRDLPLGFEPGTKERYSNTGFEVLGAVIEKAAGKSYYDFVREVVYGPAGMKDTDAFDRDLSVPGLAEGYTNQSPYGPDTGYERSTRYLHAPKGTPAGGGYGTAGDLLRFVDAVWHNRLLDASHTDLLLNRFQEGKPRSQGFGFAGGSPGTNSVIIANMEAGQIVIVLSNFDEPIAEELGQYLFDLSREDN